MRLSDVKSTLQRNLIMYREHLKDGFSILHDWIIKVTMTLPYSVSKVKMLFKLVNPIVSLNAFF